MKHEEALELLEDYVDERLAPSVRRRLEQHLGDCDDCQSILNDVAPVDLTSMRPVDVDERALRRSVRRAMWRTVIQAAGMIIALFVGVAMVSLWVVHPLLINRGDRAATVARATHDVAGMFNEGAVVDEFSIESGLTSRDVTADISIPLGAGFADLGTVSSRIGLFGFSGRDGGTFWPYAGSDSRLIGAAPQILDRLGDGTVATASALFPTPLSVEEAQQLTETTTADVSIVWAGFLLTDADPEEAARDPLRVLGYSTCSGTDPLRPELFGGSSANAGRSFGAFPASIPNALSEVRRSIDHLADHPDVTRELLGADTERSVQEKSAYLATAEPLVELLVVTGPTDEVVKFFEEADARNGRVLAVDFYNWLRPICR